MAHSTEIREKALDYLEKYKNISQVARAYGISRSTLYCWLDLKQRKGKVDRRITKARLGKIDRNELAAYIDPDAYLAEMAKHFHCSVVAVFYALRSMGMTRKKDHNVYGAGACIKWKTTCNGCDVLVIIRLFMLMKQAVVPICTGNMAGQKKRSRKGLYKRKEISA